MTQQLDRGDIIRAKDGTVWFAYEVGGEFLVSVRCVRKGNGTWADVGSQTVLERSPPAFTQIIGKAVDFEHAAAIVALKLTRN